MSHDQLGCHMINVRSQDLEGMENKLGYHETKRGVWLKKALSDNGLSMKYNKRIMHVVT